MTDFIFIGMSVLKFPGVTWESVPVIGSWDGGAPDGRVKPGHDGKKLGHDCKKPGHDCKKPEHDGKKPGHDGKKPARDGNKPEHDGTDTTRS